MIHTYNIEAIRREFPAAENMLYVDSAHQAPLAKSVHAAFHTFLEEGLVAGGPKPTWLARVPAVRQQVARLIGAKANEIAFTHNTSEGLNIAANALPLAAGDNVVLVEGDHPNNIYAWVNLQRKGVAVRFASPNGVAVDSAMLAPHIDSRTRVVALSHVTSDTGERAQLASIGELCRARGIHLVVDAIQSVGILPVDVAQMGISMLATGCHKGLLVPQGLGFLYVSEALGSLAPPFLAASAITNPVRTREATATVGSLQPGAIRFEGGNLNLPHIHALGASLTLIERIGVSNIEQHVMQLSGQFIAGLDKLHVGLHSPRERERRTHVVVVDLPASVWLDYLSARDVRISQQRGGFRVSFALFNTPNDVDRLLAIIALGLRLMAG